MEYRKANDGDIPLIQALQKQWESEDITWGYRSNTLEELHSFSHEIMLIAEEHGTAVGYIIAQTLKSKWPVMMPIGQEYLSIEDIYVRPEFRERGIGEGLIGELEKHAKDMHISYIKIFSSTKDIEGVYRFYKKCGFYSWNIEMLKKIGQ